MAEVRLLKFAAGNASQVAQASDSARLLSLGLGVASIPGSGLLDANVGVNLAGVAALAFSSTTITIGGSGWTTAAKILAGTGGNVVLSPGNVDTWTKGRASNAVTEHVDAAATSVVRDQSTLSSGTAANYTITSQAATTGTGGDLVLGTGSGSTAAGSITFKVGANEKLRCSAVGNLVFLNGTAVVGGLVGGIILGTVTTTPTSSAANQVQIWNSAGVLTCFGFAGNTFYVPPQGQGAGAPVVARYAGLAGELSEAANTIPEIFDDFILVPSAAIATGSFFSLGWVCTLAGTAAALQAVGNSVDASHWGVMQMDTGTTTTGRSVISTAANNIIVAGSGNDIIVEALINIPALSTAAQEYTIKFGIADNVSGTGAVANQVTFDYVRTTSVNWLRSSEVASGGGSNASSTPVATGWSKLRLQKIGTNYIFFVNGVNIGTQSLNLPTTQPMGIVCAITATAGTTTKVLRVDYIKISAQLGTAR